jgi:membrane fusion protein, heavy metal efflux system
MKHLSIFLIMISYLVLGCKAFDNQNHVDEESSTTSVSVTRWTDQLELFMEHPILIKAKPAKFIIHLTTLDDFKPVKEGKVILNFQHESGKTFAVNKEDLLRKGIFTPTATLPLSGKYLFTLLYRKENMEESFHIGDVIVYASSAEIPPQQKDGDTGISFLKEQQWKTEFHTEPAKIMPIRSSITAVGEVIPRQQSYAEIVSPVEGILDVEDNQHMVIPGSSVSKGQIVAILSPPLNVANSWVELKLAYQNAKSEFERAKRLMQKDAISKREYEKLRRNYLTQKAGYEAFFDPDSNKENSFFELKSPITGIVNEVSVMPGQKVSIGRKLMTIVDPSLVWLKVNVFEKDYYKIDSPESASLRFPGVNSPIVVEQNDFRLVSKGNIIDPRSRTIPLLFELSNPQRIFKIGQVVQLELYTSDEKDALCVPSKAVYDDNGQIVVFVHKEGETFEKRVVKVGDSYKGCVAILEGVKEGERIVTKGGYLVKLASTSAAIAHPHAH